VRLTLPEAGFYRLFADFVVDGQSLTLGIDLAAPGDLRIAGPTGPSEIARTGPYHVGLDVAALRAGESGALTCTVSMSGTPLRDLEPYLGTLGHLVALREGDLAYLHVHPMDSEESGPDIAFHTNFPTPGRYRRKPPPRAALMDG
jgi:hypothetical protein